METAPNWTNLPWETWAHGVAAIGFVALGFGPAVRSSVLWRGVFRSLALLVALRIVLLGNPWIWQFYGRALDPEGVGWRQSDVIRLQRDAHRLGNERARFLAVGSSQTDRIYREYAEEHEDLDMFILAGMTSIDMVLYERLIVERRPEHVLLYLSDFDLAREPPATSLVTAPRQGWRLLSTWTSLHSLPMGPSYDGAMAELLLGEVFPEAKYGFVLRGVGQKVIERVARRWGRPDPQGEPTSWEQRVSWLRDSFDGRYLDLNLHFLRRFVDDVARQGIAVVIVEGRYHPTVSDPRTRELAARTRAELTALAGQHEAVTYLPSDELVPLGEDDYTDLTHVTEEAGQRLVRAVIARVEGRTPDPYNPAVDARPQDVPWWEDRVRVLEERILEDPDAEVLLVGDSITQGWEREGREAWDGLTEDFVPLNLGIGGDRTENVLWRLRRMDLSPLHPSAVVLMIGTNNCVRASQSPAEIAEGIETIVAELRERLPGATVLLHALLPRDEPGDASRAKGEAVNAQIAGLADGSDVVFVDIGNLFVDEQGRILRDLMPDQLHLSPGGYALWARELRAQWESLGSR